MAAAVIGARTTGEATGAATGVLLVCTAIHRRMAFRLMECRQGMERRRCCRASRRMGPRWAMGQCRHTCRPMEHLRAHGLCRATRRRRRAMARHRQAMEHRHRGRLDMGLRQAAIGQATQFLLVGVVRRHSVPFRARSPEPQAHHLALQAACHLFQRPTACSMWLGIRLGPTSRAMHLRRLQQRGSRDHTRSRLMRSLLLHRGSPHRRSTSRRVKALGRRARLALQHPQSRVDRSRMVLMACSMRSVTSQRVLPASMGAQLAWRCWMLADPAWTTLKRRSCSKSSRDSR